MKMITKRIAMHLKNFAEELSGIPWQLSVCDTNGMSCYLQPGEERIGMYAQIRISEHGCFHHPSQFEVNVFKLGKLRGRGLGKNVLTLREEMQRAKETIIVITKNFK